jgi:hypothetical protein
MAISELGKTKIAFMNGLGNSLHFSQCFHDKPLVNPLRRRRRFETGWPSGCHRSRAALGFGTASAISRGMV